MLIARQYQISGRVQGVGFRYSTRLAAERENCSGWVKNLPNGDVKAFIQGDAESLRRMETWLEHGPELANVSKVITAEAQPDTNLSGFSIRRN